MSAFLCSAELISSIVNAYGGKQDAFDLLVAENIRSLKARYGETIDEWVAEAAQYKLLDTAVSPTQVVKNCDCYRYQSCEHDGYDSSIASAYVASVRECAIRLGGKTSGPQYDKAKWSFP